MFGGKSEKTNNANVQVSANASNSIVEGTSIKGDIVAGNDIRIDGTLVGKLDCKGRVIVGPQGRIEGDIKCVNAIIEGSFEGTLSVQDLLTVKETGVIHGDVSCDKLFIQTGAVFNTTCTMGGQKVKPLVNKEVGAKA
ncbi:MAG: polymer-forming cytoskeletal protein [Chitinophagales bacterium]|nr:polymer-forming cytoskeletal protein [Chitinophagales bacterium]